MPKVDLKTVMVGLSLSGCVQPHLEGFAAELISAGYALLPIRDYLRSAAHLGRWADSCGVAIEGLTNEAVAKFAHHKCQCAFAKRHGPRPTRRYVLRVRRFVDYLVRLGVVPAAATLPSKGIPEILVQFRNWMIQHRGVRTSTIHRYQTLVAKMLPALGLDPAVYDAALVRKVLLGQIQQLSRGYAKSYVVALRAFLRFLAVHGRCRAHLDRALPIVPEWKLSALPRYLQIGDVERVISSCDLSKPHGVRDRAILLLLARLGLRAGDITAMKLHDLDWEAGTLRVLGKGRKQVALPLPQDAGDAVIDYLTNARPKAGTDRVFLCANAPVRAIDNSSSISSIVRLALDRAKITDPPSKGAHLLRHSAATAMLRSGASLDVIATVLRHESPDTTAYYAKVDIEQLQRIAQPWPEEAPC